LIRVIHAKASFCDGECQALTENGLFNNDNDRSQMRFIPQSSSFDPSNPSYKINNAGSEAPLLTRTVSADAVHFNNTLHYNLHNLYGT
jgi:hypothetical protein